MKRKTKRQSNRDNNRKEESNNGLECPQRGSDRKNDGEKVRYT